LKLLGQQHKHANIKQKDEQSLDEATLVSPAVWRDDGLTPAKTGNTTVARDNNDAMCIRSFVAQAACLHQYHIIFSVCHAFQKLSSV
jgi:hypothetical protein